MHINDHSIPLVALAAALLSSGETVRAQDTSERERASIMFGAFVTDRESTTRLDSNQGSGTEVNLEDDLGLDASTLVARLGGYFWFNERHRLDVSYFDLSRDSVFRIDETIEFGNEIFAVNTVIESESKLSIVKVDYTFAILNRHRGYLGLTGGLYVASSSLELREASLGRVETSDVTAPLPVFGVRGDYEINDRITLGGAWQIFRFETEDVEGRFGDFYVGADYGFTERLAVGLAYNRVSMNLRAVENRGFEGRLNWDTTGFCST